MTGVGVRPGRMAGFRDVTTGRRDRVAPVSSRRWPSWPSNSTSWSSVAARPATRPRCTARPPGSNIALIEEGRVGGTCLHRGCIPAKELLQTAEVLRTVQRAPEFGVDAGASRRSTSTAVAGAQAARSSTGSPRASRRCSRGARSRCSTGRGEVVDAAAHTVRRRRRHRGRGRQPGRSPPARTRARSPASTSTARASCRPTTCSTLDRAAGPGRDHRRRRDRRASSRRCSPTWAARSPSRGVAAHPRAAPTSTPATSSPARSRSAASTCNTGVARHRHRGCDASSPSRGRTTSGDAVGRRRQGHRDRSAARRVSGGFGLEASGVEVDDRGFVVVDGQMRTNVAGVFAVGDVVDTPQLAHVGFAEAIVDRSRRSSASRSTPVDYEKVPWVIYCHPEVAWCGLTEEQARERGPRRRGRRRTASAATAGRMIIGETDGLVKLVADADGPVLGVHIVGPVGHRAARPRATSRSTGRPTPPTSPR